MLRSQNKVPWVKSKPKHIHQHPPQVKDQIFLFSWHGAQGRRAGHWTQRKLLPVGSHVPGTVVVKLVETKHAVVVVVEALGMSYFTPW
jgi:hypothetical protein